MKIKHLLDSTYLKRLYRKNFRPDVILDFNEIPLPEIFEIEPINTCNLRCKICHVSFMNHNNIKYLDTHLLNKLNPLKGKWVKIGSNFEPVMHPRFVDMVETLSEMDCKIDLTTNGTLLTKEMTDQIADSNIKNITVSFDSVKKGTYEKIRRRAKYDSAVRRIFYCQERFKQKDIFFSVNAVLCRSNIDEIIEMIDFWDSNDFHQLRLIFMVIRSLESNVLQDNDLLQESLYPIREYAFSKLDDAAKYVINNHLKITLSSPYYNWSKLLDSYPNNINENLVKSNNQFTRDYFNPAHHYQKGNYPGIQGDCRSPFTFARILFNGDVQLCYKYTVGNLNKQNFKDIWYGKKAQKVRRMIISDVTICKQCDYFRFCLNSNKIDINDKRNYFEKGLIEESNSFWDD